MKKTNEKEIMPTPSEWKAITDAGVDIADDGHERLDLDPWRRARGILQEVLLQAIVFEGGRVKIKAEIAEEDFREVLKLVFVGTDDEETMTNFLSIPLPLVGS